MFYTPCSKIGTPKRYDISQDGMCGFAKCYAHGTLLQYPLSDTLMKPASNPTYYQGLLKELQEAPQRSWFGRIINSWKGFLRFSWANWNWEYAQLLLLEESNSWEVYAVAKLREGSRFACTCKANEYLRNLASNAMSERIVAICRQFHVCLFRLV